MEKSLEQKIAGLQTTITALSAKVSALEGALDSKVDKGDFVASHNLEAGSIVIDKHGIRTYGGKLDMSENAVSNSENNKEENK